MNNPWAYALITLGLIVMFLARDIPRAWKWLGVGGASFVASSLFWDYGNHELHPIFTLACDSLVCLAVYRGAKEIWELGLFMVFWGSVITSLFMLGGFIPATWMYASWLEFWNATALCIVGGVGIVQRMGQNEGAVLHSFHMRLHSSRDSL